MNSDQEELRRQLDIAVANELGGTNRCPKCRTPLHHNDRTQKGFDGWEWWAQVRCPKQENSTDGHYWLQSPPLSVDYQPNSE
jgi:hypothetical protein